MEQEFFKATCPNCGAELQIPAQLAQFSCLYCGARLNRAELENRVPIDADAAAADYAAALPALAGCITRYPGYQRKIVRDEFEAAFAAYQKGCEPVLRQLDVGVQAAAEKTALLQQAADRMLDDLSATWTKRVRQEEDKVILAVFFVPLARKLGLDCGEEFCQLLQKTWLSRWPKTPFYLGTYEDIAKGFQRRKLCFITTAVCEAEGKPDDCEELTAFRAFRDDWLLHFPEGKKLVEEYYNIAPGIVICIDLCSDREQRYAALRRDDLGPCYDRLLAGDKEGCKEQYIRMVQRLKQEFLS